MADEPQQNDNIIPLPTLHPPMERCTIVVKMGDLEQELECDHYVLVALNEDGDGGFKISAHVSTPQRPIMMLHSIRTLAKALSAVPEKQLALLARMVLNTLEHGVQQLKKLVDDTPET